MNLTTKYVIKLVYKHTNCQKSPPLPCNYINYIIFLQIQDPYNNFTKINGHKKYTFFKL